jgi:hypothetical protein
LNSFCTAAARATYSHHRIMLPDEQMSPEQLEAYRRMPPRLALAERLYWSARPQGCRVR